MSRKEKSYIKNPNTLSDAAFDKIIKQRRQ